MGELRLQKTAATAKRVIRDNTAEAALILTESLALLQYLNTPLKKVNNSPAQLTSGKQLRNGVSTRILRWTGLGARL